MKVAPLRGSFMMVSMLGLLVSVLYVFNISPAFGAAFSIIFLAMFISSIISFIYAPVEEYPHYGEKKYK